MTMTYSVGPAAVLWPLVAGLALACVLCGGRCLPRAGTHAHRLPHLSHMLMGLAMIAMLGQYTAVAAVRSAAQLAFVALLPFLVRSTMRRWREERDSEALEGARHATSLLAMVYMLTMPQLSLPPLNVLLITYFAVGTVADAGLLLRVPSLERAVSVLVATAMTYMLVVMDALGRSDAHVHHLF
jgi:Domain of unknown function (DUF5134)